MKSVFQYNGQPQNSTPQLTSTIAPRCNVRVFSHWRKKWIGRRANLPTCASCSLNGIAPQRKLLKTQIPFAPGLLPAGAGSEIEGPCGPWIIKDLFWVCFDTRSVPCPEALEGSARTEVNRSSPNETPAPARLSGPFRPAMPAKWRSAISRLIPAPRFSGRCGHRQIRRDVYAVAITPP